jgi:hypothetical protein
LTIGNGYAGDIVECQAVLDLAILRIQQIDGRFGKCQVAFTFFVAMTIEFLDRSRVLQKMKIN